MIEIEKSNVLSQQNEDPSDLRVKGNNSNAFFPAALRERRKAITQLHPSNVTLHPEGRKGKQVSYGCWRWKHDEVGSGMHPILEVTKDRI